MCIPLFIPLSSWCAAELSTHEQRKLIKSQVGVLEQKGRMNEWMSGWMNEWMNERMDGWMNEQTNGWMNEWMNKWMNEWMNGEWVDEWRNE